MRKAGFDVEHWDHILGKPFETSFVPALLVEEGEPRKVQYIGGGMVGGVTLNVDDQTFSITTLTGARTYTLNLETNEWTTENFDGEAWEVCPATFTPV